MPTAMKYSAALDYNFRLNRRALGANGGNVNINVNKHVNGKPKSKLGGK